MERKNALPAIRQAFRGEIFEFTDKEVNIQEYNAWTSEKSKDIQIASVDEVSNPDDQKCLHS